MRILAFIEDEEVIEKVLTHLDLWLYPGVRFQHSSQFLGAAFELRCMILF